MAEDEVHISTRPSDARAATGHVRGGFPARLGADAAAARTITALDLSTAGFSAVLDHEMPVGDRTEITFAGMGGRSA